MGWTHDMIATSNLFAHPPTHVATPQIDVEPGKRTISRYRFLPVARRVFFLDPSTPARVSAPDYAIFVLHKVGKGGWVDPQLSEHRLQSESRSAADSGGSAAATLLLAHSVLFPINLRTRRE